MEEQNILESAEYRSFPFFRILYRNMILIICIILIGTAIGTAYGILRVKPVYSATCDIIVNAKVRDNETVSAGTSFTKQYMPTLADYIKTREVEDKAKAINRAVSRGAVNVTYNNDSLILSITYTDASADAASTKLGVFIEAIKQSFEKPPIPAKSISIEELQNKYNITTSSSTSNYILIGFVAGAVLGVVIAVLRYVLDNKMKDKEELEEIAGVSLLAYIDKD